MTAPHLSPGHTIADRYTVTALLGFTGEVATYRVNSHQGEMVVRLFDPTIAQRADVMGELERVHNVIHQLPAGAVRVADSGYDAGTGAPYTATELVQSPSLAQLLQQGPMAVDVVSRMVGKLAEILDAAHAQGVVHRGLKPTNIFVDPSGEVRVTDFNSAVVRSTSPTHEAYARAAPWWAPEQMHPSATLGPTTDVFAVGLLAFFALTGRSFWQSCQSQPPDLQAWQGEVMAPRPTPSERAGQLGVQLNPLLDSTLAATLKVSPGERYQSVGELARAFAALTGPLDADNPQTMAFDAMNFNLPSENPAPAAGGYQGAPGDSSGAGAGAAASSAGYPDAGGGYAGGNEPPGMTPGLPPIPVQAKKKKSPIVPIAIGIGVAVILFGGVGLYFTLGTDDEVPDPTLASAEPTGATDGDAPGDGDADEADGGADDEDGDDADEGEGETEVDPDAPVSVTVKCKPVDCKLVTVDAKRVTLSEEGTVELAPGKHVIVATSPGYLAKKETIEVEPGKPMEQEFELKKLTGRPPPRPKPCGHFLNPCK